MEADICGILNAPYSNHHGRQLVGEFLGCVEQDEAESGRHEDDPAV